MKNGLLRLLLPAMLFLAGGGGWAQPAFPDRVAAGTQRRYWIDSTAFPGSVYTWSIDGMIVQSGATCALDHTWNRKGIHEVSVEWVTREGCRSACLTGQVEVATEEVKVFPNPVTGSFVNLVISLQEDAFTTIDILSSSGRSEDRVFEGRLEGGRPYGLRIRHSLKQGLYTCRIRAGDRILTGRFLVIRSY